MQLHEIKAIHKNKSSKRIGRGGKKGTYSGKGIKGQKSRAGRKPRLGFAGGDTTIAKRLPKQKGSVGKVPIKKGTKSSLVLLKPVILSLDKIKEIFPGDNGSEIVSPKTLIEKGIVAKVKGRIPKIKILAGGKAGAIGHLKFRGLKLSASVREQMKKPARPAKKATTKETLPAAKTKIKKERKIKKKA